MTVNPFFSCLSLTRLLSSTTRLRRLINAGQVVLFMKGSSDEPKCGFSKKMVAILKDEGINFASFDILQDEDVRQGLKKFSNWPTYPQLYVNGELVGKYFDGLRGTRSSIVSHCTRLMMRACLIA